MAVQFLVGPLVAGGVLSLLLMALQPSHAETVTGTGFAVTFDGMVITNHHVIGGFHPQSGRGLKGARTTTTWQP